jgi:hypothetical protein
MKSDKTLKYGIGGLVLLIFALAWLTSPETPALETWHQADKDAFGGYVLHQLVEDYTGQNMPSVFVPLGEIPADSLSDEGNYFLISNTINLSSDDWETIKNRMENGATVVMATNHLDNETERKLGLEFRPILQDGNVSLTLQELMARKIRVRFSDLGNLPQTPLDVPLKAANYYLTLQSEQDSLMRPRVIAEIEGKGPVLVDFQMGQGHLLVSSMPLVLSNYFCLNSDSRKLGFAILSYLNPAKENRHFEFYHLGRIESQTKLRVVLGQPSLRIALYLSLLLVAIYMFFGSKRRQRVVPVLVPLKNESLAFLNRLSTLYHENSHHRNLLEKRMEYFKEFVLRKYRIRLTTDPNAFELLAKKLNPDPVLLGELNKYYQLAFHKAKPIIAVKDLLESEKALYQFYKEYRYG